MYKFNQNILPSSISSLFKTRSDIHRYNTKALRISALISLALANINPLLGIMGIWNTLPFPLLLSTTVDNFKTPKTISFK